MFRKIKLGKRNVTTTIPDEKERKHTRSLGTYLGVWNLWNLYKLQI
jgi:hypothetical protein